MYYNPEAFPAFDELLHTAFGRDFHGRVYQAVVIRGVKAALLRLEGKTAQDLPARRRFNFEPDRIRLVPVDVHVNSRAVDVRMGGVEL